MFSACPPSATCRSTSRSRPVRCCSSSVPRGSGKSTLVQHALTDRPGKVAIEFSDEMIATQMYRAIAKRVCPGKPALHERASEKTVLVDLLRRATANHCKKTGNERWVPTIFVEVSRRVTRGTLKSVLHVLKGLACDQKLCKVIVYYLTLMNNKVAPSAR
mmetsp:Transcript_34278/g.80886  ORF Transcript_34278/g.80886 Transcript_34278/m.80886 type:complete len:160 (+) Transcript_34278:297-776(+)